MARKVITTFSHQIFLTGFVHGDPHPGNVLIRPAPHNNKMAQVVLLDHGLYTRLEEEMRVSLCKMWKSIVKDDLNVIQSEAQKLGVEGEGSFFFTSCIKSWHVAILRTVLSALEC